MHTMYMPPSQLGSDDPLIWTPSAVAAELNRILGVFDTVNNDASAASAAKLITSAEWDQWHATYLNAHDFLTTASTLWGSNVKTAREHEQEAAKWRALLQSRGQQVQGPTDLIRQPTSASSSGYTAIIVVGGILLGGFAALKLWKAFKV